MRIGHKALECNVNLVGEVSEEDEEHSAECCGVWVVGGAGEVEGTVDGWGRATKSAEELPLGYVVMVVVVGEGFSGDVVEVTNRCESSVEEDEDEAG